MGEQRQNIPLIFDLFSSLANLLIRLCGGSDYTKANSTFGSPVCVSSSGCCDDT